MAYREIEHPEDFNTDGKYLKFGEVFPGVDAEPFVGIFQNSAPNQFKGTNFTFILPDRTLGTLGVKGPLKKQLEKAQLQKGEKVTISVVGEEDGFLRFKVKVEDGPKGGVKVKKPEFEDPF